MRSFSLEIKLLKDVIKKEKDMAVRILQILVCTASLISLQGCFVWHSTSVRENPPSQTRTTVYHEPAGEAVAVTTTR